jgi:hypothetical protein
MKVDGIDGSVTLEGHQKLIDVQGLGGYFRCARRPRLPRPVERPVPPAGSPTARAGRAYTLPTEKRAHRTA